MAPFSATAQSQGPLKMSDFRGRRHQPQHTQQGGEISQELLGARKDSERTRGVQPPRYNLTNPNHQRLMTLHWWFV